MKKLVFASVFVLGLSGCISAGGYTSSSEAKYTEGQLRCLSMFYSPYFRPIVDKVQLIASEVPLSNQNSPELPTPTERKILKDFVGLHEMCEPLRGTFGDSPDEQWDNFYYLMSGKMPWVVFNERRYARIRSAGMHAMQESNRRWQGIADQQSENARRMVRAWRPPATWTTTCSPETALSELKCTTTVSPY